MRAAWKPVRPLVPRTETELRKVDLGIVLARYAEGVDESGGRLAAAVRRAEERVASVDGWSVAPVPAATTDTLTRFSGAGKWYAPRAGSVRTIMAVLGLAVSAGSCTVKILKGGVAIPGCELVIGVSTELVRIIEFDRNRFPFAQLDDLQPQYVTDGAWSPHATQSLAVTLGVDA